MRRACFISAIRRITAFGFCDSVGQIVNLRPIGNRPRAGQPCIRGLRVTVWDVLDMLASGMTEDEILEDFPCLEKADFPAVYAYASSSRPRLIHGPCCLRIQR